MTTIQRYPHTITNTIELRLNHKSCRVYFYDFSNKTRTQEFSNLFTAFYCFSTNNLIWQ